ncbi:hypothetical protein FYJ58_03285 [Lachnospiraceae bacterium WCA-693-APC-MOT-I]|uniref:Uncharacterized protein n=1 Tax=Velocimicrobium porci TaxID=2606634 RepID=A0A6L5XVQ4_9FIRM|nr:hypothetical protein [Velocimicrobium porci]
MFCWSQKKKISKKIALVGLEHGAGTTHVGVLLADYFRQNQGARTAYIECNKTSAFSKLQECLYGYQRKCFQIQRVDYYIGGSEQQLEALFGKNYDYFILDFGIELKNNEEKIKSCEERLFIGNLERWEQKDYICFGRQYQEYNWTFVCNLGRKDIAHNVEKNLHKKLYKIGYQPISQPLTREVEQFFYSLR